MRNLIMKSGALLLSVLAIALIYSSCAKPNSSSADDIYHEELSKSLSDYEIFSLDYEAVFSVAQNKPNSPVQINLNIPSHPKWEFNMTNDDLTQYDEEGFQAIEIGENSTQTVIQEAERFALEGNLNQNNLKSYLTFSLGKMEALIQDEGNEYWIQSLSNYVPEAPANLYVIFNGKDEFVEGTVCGTDEKSDDPPSNIGSIRATPKKINITYLGDYQMYQKFNNTTNAYNWMYWRFYYANKRYNSYNSIPFNWIRRRAYLYSWSGSANYNPKTKSNKQTFVDECSAYYNYSWYVEGNVNYFFTGDDVTGVWGKADGISRMCSDASQAFSFGEVGTKTASATSQTYFGQNLMAHEVGHTIAASHDNSSNNWMNSWYKDWNTTCGTNAKANFNSKYGNPSFPQWSSSWCLGF